MCSPEGELLSISIIYLWGSIAQSKFQIDRYPHELQMRYYHEVDLPTGR